jgi:heme/copper-type cytochrome/quinol oxidase subunit 3
VASRTLARAAAAEGIMGTLREPIRPMTLDVSDLPSVAFGPSNTTWFANLLYMAIEGTMFALMWASYFYLRTRVQDWPPGHLAPDLRYGVASVVIFLLSIVPALWVQKRAPLGDRSAIRMGLIVLAAFALLATAIRVFEFTTLNCRWSDDAYSSTLWVLIGMHAGHLVTELIETLVILAIAFTPKMEGTRLADAAINSDYWYFVVVSGLLMDFLIYGTTRFL